MSKKPKKKPKTKRKSQNWPRLKTRFLASKHGSLEQFAKDNKLSLSTVKKHSYTEGWVTERAELEPAAMNLARKKIIEEIAEDAVVRMRDWLTVADTLKGTAITALLEKGKDMDLGEAIKAIKLAADLEGRVFGMETKQPEAAGDGNSINLTQVNIGELNQTNQTIQATRDEIQRKLDGIVVRNAAPTIPSEPDPGGGGDA